MSQTTKTDNSDLIVDRRNLKRSLNKWRGVAIGVFLAALWGLVTMNDRLAAHLGVSDQIARIEISGIILEDQARTKMLEKLANDDGVKALLVKFNSPGGTTTGGEALYTELRTIAKTRPVVAVFGTMATSAAYMSGVAADHIVARGNSITGSVGVIMQWAEVSGLMEKLGVQMNEMKSGNLKAVPSPFVPLNEEGRALTQDMIDESHRWFVDLVVSRRNIKVDQIPGFMKGRIFSGRQALEFGLVDKIGGEAQALEWLTKTKKIDEDLPVIDWASDDQDQSGFLGLAARSLSHLFGFDVSSLVASFGTGAPSQTGLVSSARAKLISKWH